MLQVGQVAPDFHAVNAKMEEVSLSDFKGKKVILNIFPSLDTPTCALSVRQFNAQAAGLENKSCYVFPWTFPSHNHVSVLPKGWIMSFRCPYSAAVILSHTTVSSRRTSGRFNGPCRHCSGREREGKLHPAGENISHEPDYEAALKAAQ